MPAFIRLSSRMALWDWDLRQSTSAQDSCWSVHFKFIYFFLVLETFGIKICRKKDRVCMSHACLHPPNPLECHSMSVTIQSLTTTISSFVTIWNYLNYILRECCLFSLKVNITSYIPGNKVDKDEEREIPERIGRDFSEVRGRMIFILRIIPIVVVSDDEDDTILCKKTVDDID